MSSPLKRALQTAEPIARVSCVDLLIDDDLVDRDYGPCAGHTLAEVMARWGTVDQAPGVEPWDSLSRRAAGVLHKDFQARPVVLVTHDAVLHAMLHHFDPAHAAAQQDPACWDVLARDAAGRLQLSDFNLHAPLQHGQG